MKKVAQCLSCGSKNSRVLYESRDRMFDVPGTFLLRQCKKCKLVFLCPQPNREVLRRHYPTKDYFAYQSGGKSPIFLKLQRYIVKNSYTPTLAGKLVTFLVGNTFGVPKKVAGGKVLDVGCGTGDMLILLKELGWDVYGIDIDMQAINIAKKRGLKHMRVGTFKNVVNYPDNYFDSIRLYHVIEHVDDPVACIEILAKKIKKGGQVFLSTPNFDSPIPKFFGKYWGSLDTPRHLFIFTPRILEDIAKRCGFSVSCIEYNSALGISGSMQYFFNDLFKRKGNFFGQLPVVLTLASIEWILDRMAMGDLFTIELSKNE